MKSLDSSNKIELVADKILGKKIKRFKNSLKPNIRDQKKPPTLSESTLIQIEKVINNKKNKYQKTIKASMTPIFLLAMIHLILNYQNCL